MITFVGGDPNPLANMDSRGSISDSGFRPGGPNPLGHRRNEVARRKRWIFPFEVNLFAH